MLAREDVITTFGTNLVLSHAQFNLFRVFALPEIHRDRLLFIPDFRAVGAFQGTIDIYAAIVDEFSSPAAM
jgi:hypothetical protein